MFQNTKINHEIDPYLYGINEVLEGLSREELIKKVFSVEFTRFFNYYKKAKDLNISVKAEAMEASGDSTRYFINIGRRDGFDWMSLKDFLKEATGLGDDVYHVDCKDNFSFFNTDTDKSEMVLALFENFELSGRQVHVEITKDRGRKGGGGGGGRKKKNFGGGGGGFKGRSRGGDRDGGNKGSYGGKKRKSNDGNIPFKGKKRRRK